MAERVLCEIKTCPWTGMEYPVRYAGNFFYTTDSKALQDFKNEVLAEHPELKRKLKIMTVKSQQEKQSAAYEAMERNPGYLEWKAMQTWLR